MDPNVKLSFTQNDIKNVERRMLAFQRAETVAQVQDFDACMPLIVPIENDTPIAENAETWTNLFWTTLITYTWIESQKELLGTFLEGPKLTKTVDGISYWANIILILNVLNLLSFENFN